MTQSRHFFTGLKRLFSPPTTSSKTSPPSEEPNRPWPQLQGPERAGKTLLSPPRAEMSVSELADGSDWEGKKARVWKSGETILDTYRVLDVKTGGMGYVYIAEHLKWRSQLAIKAPNEQVLSNRLFFGRVLREADAWINLGMHPHIAFCYYVRQIEGVPHLFIEYVDGGNLRDWIVDQRCYDLGVSLDLAIQFCHGMAYAHHQGMIHRDIKPENILMTKDGHLKVTDFGIARTGPMTDDRLTMAISPRQTGIIGQELTLFGTKMGSFDYMAPEQWEDPSSVDGRADIYSFGVCLYEMICGQKPFESASELAASILAQLEGRAPRDPLSIRSNIPRELSEVLRKCCRLQQDERFASFDQLRMELIGVFERLFDRLPPHAEASAIDPKADGLNNRGVSYLDLGRVDEAEHAWQQALKEDPQHLEATFNLSYLHWQRSEIPDDICLAQLQRLEGRNEKSPDYWRCLAWLHFERGDRQAIAELVEKKRPVMDETFKSALSSPDAPMGRWQFAFKTHPSHVSSVACSPDGLYVLSGCWDETVRLLDVNTWKEAKSFRGHDSAVTSVGFSPDGRLAMSASWDGTVRIWKVSSGREVRRFERHEGLVFTAEFSPDGRRASSGGQDRMVRLWEVGSGKELWAVEGHAQEVNRVCFSPDGQYLLSGSSDRTARLWDLRSRKEVRRFHGHGGAVNTVAFAPDGQHVVTGSADKSIRIWNIQTGKAIRHLLGHAGKVEAIAISLDGRFILSGGADELVRLWETETGKAIRAFDWHRGGVTSVCFSQDGGRVISGSADKTVSVWSISYPPVDRIPFSPFPLLSKVKPVASLSAERETVNQLLETARKAIETKSYDRAHEVLREGQQVAGFHRDPEILKLLALGGTRWGRAGLKDSWSLVILRGHTAAIESVCFSPDNRFLASASADRTIRLWETTSGKEVQRFEGHAGEVRSVCFLADGLHILSGGSDRTARLWEIQSGREIHRLADFGNPITTVSLASSGPTALFAGGGWEDRSDPSQNVTLEVWDLRGRCRTGNLIGHTAIVNAACYSPDSEYIVSGSSDHTVRIWETKGYQQVRQIDGHISGVTAVACAPTGDLILSGSLDETVRLWDFRSGEEIRRLVGHTAAVRSISFTPDGRYALTASDDHTARLWEIDSGKEIHRFKGQHGAIRAVSFSPDARYAASGAEDLTVWVWEFDWHWDVRLVAGR